MQIYFIQFLAYTMAMVGFLSVCLLVYKKFYVQTKAGKGNDCLYIENALRLNPKKQIYIVRAGKERFLVASDAENTTMLAKLAENSDVDAAETLKLVSEKSDNSKTEVIKNPISLSSFKKLTQNNNNGSVSFKRMKMKA
ncbi:MAG: flagellar biosynthetic protein FliO [Candidatus Gastranaerophilales bacterium]|nr:flagellar biosynthetic protein FliO [Candidatus Gastranaerophilales bacterium]